MFNDKKIEDIRKRIQVSTLLTIHEKADWLNLLELMNDKQLGELEEILSNEKPSVQTAPKPITPSAAAVVRPPITLSRRPVSPVQLPGQKLPPLSHIANMPTNIGMVRPAQLPKPTPTPAVQQPKPVATPPAPPKPVPPKPAPTPAVPKLAFVLEHAEDLQNLNVETLRSYELQSIINGIKTSITEHGYFQVLQLIEASALYESYILSGQDQLQGQGFSKNSNPNRLTQTEFEFMTDLLSNMRFNRL